MGLDVHAVNCYKGGVGIARPYRMAGHKQPRKLQTMHNLTSWLNAKASPRMIWLAVAAWALLAVWSTFAMGA